MYGTPLLLRMALHEAVGILNLVESLLYSGFPARPFRPLTSHKPANAGEPRVEKAANPLREQSKTEAAVRPPSPG